MALTELTTRITAFLSKIAKPERVVFDHVSGPHFQVTVTFEEQDGRTKIIFRQLFETVEVYNQIKKFAVEGNEQNFDRLEALLQSAARVEDSSSGKNLSKMSGAPSFVRQ